MDSKLDSLLWMQSPSWCVIWWLVGHFAEESGRDNAFLLEAVTGQSDVKTFILQFRGLEDFVGLGVRTWPRSGRLYKRRVSGDVAPCFGYISLSLLPFGGGAGKSITVLQLIENKSNGGEGGIRTPDTR